MKHLLHLVCLPAALLGGTVALADGVAPPAPEAAAPAVADARLVQILGDMQKTRDADFFSASTYMLESTGDELAFVRAMEGLARRGNPVAMCWMAMHMDRSRGAEACNMLCQVAADYTPALVPLARLVYEGWEGQAPDKIWAKDILMTACKTGDAEARALYIKWGHLEGPEADCNRPEVRSELKRHNYRLEEYMADIPGLDHDWLKEASDHGSPRAAFGMYQRLAESSPDEAMVYLHLAAERHYPVALELLGCLRYGKAAPGGDEAKNALQLVRQAAATGDDPQAAALVALAYAYCIIGQGEHDASAAPDAAAHVAALFRFAHERGCALGTAGWGYCMVAGKGCTQDTAQGLSLLESAAQDVPDFAHLALYHIYAEGIGVPADAQKAAQHLDLFQSSPANLPALWIFAPKSPSAIFMPGVE